MAHPQGCARCQSRPRLPDQHDARSRYAQPTCNDSVPNFKQVFRARHIRSYHDDIFLSASKTNQALPLDPFQDFLPPGDQTSVPVR
jgi:hypothetical protein